MNVFLLTHTEVFQILISVRYQFTYITHTMMYIVSYIHTYCHFVRALKMVVVICYKTRITAYQSTASRCNISQSIYTRHIAVTPHYHTITARNPHAPSYHSFFSVRPNNIVTFLRPRYDFVPRSFLENLLLCELTTKTVWQTCIPRLHAEIRVASRGQGIVSVASQGDRFKCIICVPSCQPQT